MQQSMRDLRDNQVVQGQLLHRVETNLDGLGEKFDRLEGVVEKLADGQVLLTSALKGLVVTVEGLSATVDRFI